MPLTTAKYRASPKMAPSSGAAPGRAALDEAEQMGGVLHDQAEADALRLAAQDLDPLDGELVEVVHLRCEIAAGCGRPIGRTVEADGRLAQAAEEPARRAD